MHAGDKTSSGDAAVALARKSEGFLEDLTAQCVWKSEQCMSSRG